MHRFFIDNVEGDQAFLTDTGQFHHLKDVLRLKAGDETAVFDSHGHEYAGIIAALTDKQVIIKVKLMDLASLPATRLTMACAVPKAGRLDDVIDHLTQLGVERIIPLWTERVVVRLDDLKKDARVERWRKIALSAARQSQQSRIPEIAPVTPLAEVISGSTIYDLKLIPTVDANNPLIKKVVNQVKPANILVLIGPEGDFTSGEIKLALDHGFIPVSLGETVLRVAAAAVAVASFLKFALS